MKNRLLLIKKLIFTFLIFVSPIIVNAQQSLWVGESYRFDVTSAVIGSTANLQWSTSGGYLELSGTGFYRNITVTKYFEGSATVTCEWDYRLTGSGQYSHTRKDVTITCRDNKVSISPTSLTLNPGETSQVGYYHQFNNQYTSSAVTYFQSTNSNIVTVDSNTGILHAISPGTAYINVYSTISSDSPCCQVTVNQVQPASVSIPSSLSLVAETSQKVTATLTPSNAESTLIWSSDNTNIATVSSTGIITAINPGSANIKVTTNNNLCSICKLIVTEPKMTLVSSKPNHEASNIPVTNCIHAIFSCDIYKGDNFYNITLSDSKNNRISGDVSIQNKEIIFDPEKTLSESTSYTLHIPIGSIKNKWETTNSVAYSVSFKTGKKEKLFLDFSQKSGIVEEGTSISLTCNNTTASIYYTIDNSDPYKNGVLYKTPLIIDQTKTIKAYATNDGYIDSDIINATYIIGNGNSITSDSYLSISNTSITPNTSDSLSILLENPNENITFIQFDIYLPHQVYISEYANNKDLLSDRVPNNNEIIELEPQKDGGIRVILASYENQFIEGKSGAIIKFPISAIDGVYEELVYISNITMVTPNEKIITPLTNYATISINNNTDIKSIDKNEDLTITINNEILTLLSSKDMIVYIYRLDSKLVSKISLKCGVSKTIVLPKGIYIINNKKIKI